MRLPSKVRTAVTFWLIIAMVSQPLYPALGSIADSNGGSSSDLDSNSRACSGCGHCDASAKQGLCGCCSPSEPNAGHSETAFGEISSGDQHCGLQGRTTLPPESSVGRDSQKRDKGGQRVLDRTVPDRPDLPSERSREPHALRIGSRNREFQVTRVIAIEPYFGLVVPLIEPPALELTQVENSSLHRDPTTAGGGFSANPHPRAAHERCLCMPQPPVAPPCPARGDWVHAMRGTAHAGYSLPPVAQELSWWNGLGSSTDFLLAHFSQCLLCIWRL